MRSLVTIVSLLVSCAATASQEKKVEPKKEPPPKVLYSVPLVVRPGEKQKLALRGKHLASVKDVKVLGADGAKVRVLGAKAVGVPNNYPADRVGDSEVEIELELPKDAKPGAVKLIAAGASDSNEYRPLVRDDLPTVTDKEDNGAFGSAQLIALPVAVEGTIKGERDVDVFKFVGKKGQKVRIEVQAARFGSPLDGFLTVCDANRNILDTVDDADGSADPVVTLTLPGDGAYYVSLIDAHDLGGPNFGYRLLVKPE
ncbi:PPC domain-containing protein [Gemmata sp. JC717]|uniref:PPC domain-containing protein n=1 Tax=Gemmata algarum TaxID=2975278 RepID=UPI0021BB6BA3|nr:PPC domain-containing protein [Gemmata algarum]MDY3553079.1 PPC domain-containing protein [Gemmata algarum]